MQFFISIICIIVAVFCFLSGIYVLHLNHNERLNKISFFICIALTCLIWGIEQSLTATNIQEALNWRRFSEVGSLMVFALLLDFVLTITMKEKLQKNVWLKISLYIPIVILGYGVVISEKISNQIFHFTKSPIGWIALPGMSLWTILANGYVFLSLFVGLGFLVLWKIRNQKDSKVKKQAEIILFAYIISLIILVISQWIFHYMKLSYVHELMPLLIPIPISFILMAVIKYQFMQEQYEDVIMEKFRTKIIRNLSAAYIAGGVIYFMTQYFGEGERNASDLFVVSFILIGFGIIIYLTQKFCIIEKTCMLIYSILLTMTVPIVTFKFIDNSAITVWSFSFIIIIASVLLYDSAIFIMVTTVTIVTQIYLWIFIPENFVSLDKTDYFGRILIFGVAAILVSYINKIYAKRLKQLSNNIKDQDLLFQVSSNIIDMTSANKKDKVMEIIELLGISMKAERVLIYLKSLDVAAVEPEYYVWGKKQQVQKKSLEELELYEKTWWKNQVRENGFVKIEEDAVVAVPICGNSIQCGFLRIDYNSKHSNFCENVVQTLNTIGNILGKAEDKIRVELEMENMAYYDQLTQLPNRHLFGKYVEQWIMHSKKIKNSFSIFFLDIDSFKNINDISGHRYGDRVLVKVAEKIESCLRKTDIICRFGGDEFLIMFHHVNVNADAGKVADKIIHQFQTPTVIDEIELNITVSIGISVYPEDGTDKDTLIKNADIAMYKAKSEGKNKFVFCSEKMKSEISREMTIINYLYKALEKGEFELVYQPQIRADTCEIVAVEALIRWNHPILGSIPPGVFIPLAEKNGLIVAIGDWVMLEACRQNKKWQRDGYPKIRVAVNVSVNQLLLYDFPEKVKNILEKVKLDPNYLEIEITENVAMQESELMISSLSKLKELGISIAIDDFGVEYSSLTRIKDLPIDRIKLDIQFIKNILINEKERQITDAIIHLARKLNLKVIAEGVEEKEQFLYLKEKKCDEIQGYYFYKPLSVLDIEEVLKR